MVKRVLFLGEGLSLGPPISPCIARHSGTPVTSAQGIRDGGSLSSLASCAGQLLSTGHLLESFEERELHLRKFLR